MLRLSATMLLAGSAVALYTDAHLKTAGTHTLLANDASFAAGDAAGGAVANSAAAAATAVSEASTDKSGASTDKSNRYVSVVNPTTGVETKTDKKTGIVTIVQPIASTKPTDKEAEEATTLMTQAVADASAQPAAAKPVREQSIKEDFVLAAQASTVSPQPPGADGLSSLEEERLDTNRPGVVRTVDPATGLETITDTKTGIITKYHASPTDATAPPEAATTAAKQDAIKEAFEGVATAATEVAKIVGFDKAANDAFQDAIKGDNRVAAASTEVDNKPPAAAADAGAKAEGATENKAEGNPDEAKAGEAKDAKTDAKAGEAKTDDKAEDKKEDKAETNAKADANASEDTKSDEAKMDEAAKAAEQKEQKDEKPKQSAPETGASEDTKSDEAKMDEAAKAAEQKDQKDEKPKQSAPETQAAPVAAMPNPHTGIVAAGLQTKSSVAAATIDPHTGIVHGDGPLVSPVDPRHPLPGGAAASAVKEESVDEASKTRTYYRAYNAAKAPPPGKRAQWDKRKGGWDNFHIAKDADKSYISNHGDGVKELLKAKEEAKFKGISFQKELREEKYAEDQRLKEVAAKQAAWEEANAKEVARQAAGIAAQQAALQAAQEAAAAKQEAAAAKQAKLAAKQAAQQATADAKAQQAIADAKAASSTSEVKSMTQNGHPEVITAAEPAVATSADHVDADAFGKRNGQKSQKSEDEASALLDYAKTANAKAKKAGGKADAAPVESTSSCFAKDLTSSCRLVEMDATPQAAFAACYPASTRRGRLAAAEASVAELVLMASLKAGDLVLTSDANGGLALTHVLVNQHATVAELTARVLTLHTSNGARLSLTPDHAIYIDGALAAAATAVVGASLTDAHGRSTTISRIVETLDAPIINPVTASGTILAADRGAPLLAASHPIWIAPLLLSSSLVRSTVNGALLVCGDVSSVGLGAAVVLAKLAATLGGIRFAAKALRRKRRSA
jgi:hypothetical protein